LACGFPVRFPKQSSIQNTAASQHSEMSADEFNKMAHATDTPASREDTDEAQSNPPVIVEGDDQHGIQNVEAVTLSWSKTSLILVFLK